jgi:hypothetical protein
MVAGGECFMDIKKWCNNRGSATLLSLFVMFIILMVGIGLLRMASTDYASAANYNDGVDAQYAAEAGVQRAVVELQKTTPVTSMAKTNVRKSDGTYRVTYRYEAKEGTYEKQNVYIVTSIGEVWSADEKLLARRQAVATIRRSSFPNLINAKGAVYIDGTGKIVGESADKPSTIGVAHGILTGNDPTHRTACSIVTSNDDFPTNPYVYDSTFATKYKTADANSFTNEETNSGNLGKAKYYINGGTVKNITSTRGDAPIEIYVKGDVTIEGPIKGNIKIIATGNITTNSNATFPKEYTVGSTTYDSSIGLYAGGDIKVGVSIEAPSQIYCKGKFTLNGATPKPVLSDTFIFSEYVSTNLQDYAVDVSSEIHGKIYTLGSVKFNNGGELHATAGSSGGGKSFVILKWSKK